jgi:hypothetical protein
MLKAGFLGYLCLVWMAIVYVVRVMRHWHYIVEPEFKGLALGFMLVFAGTWASAIAVPIFMQGFWVSVLGITMGISEVIVRNFSSISPSQGAMSLVREEK